MVWIRGGYLQDAKGCQIRNMCFFIPWSFLDSRNTLQIIRSIWWYLTSFFFNPLQVFEKMNFNVSSCWNWQKKSFKHLKRGNGSFTFQCKESSFHLLKHFTITFLPKKVSFLFYFFKEIALCEHSKHWAELMTTWL